MSNWLSSTETSKHLKISACELMHKRERGELKFKKVGNAFFYQLPADLHLSDSTQNQCNLANHDSA